MRRNLLFYFGFTIFSPEVIPVQPDLTQTMSNGAPMSYSEKMVTPLLTQHQMFPGPPSPAQSRAPLLEGQQQQRSLTPSSTGKPPHSGSCPSVVSSAASTGKLKCCKMLILHTHKLLQ